MNSRRAAAWLAFSVVLASSQALAALSIVAEGPAAAAVGVPQTFEITGVTGNVGSVTFRWNFGDGTLSEPTTDLTSTHVYAAPGHYNVIAQAADDASRTSDVFVLPVVNSPSAVPPHNSSSIIYDAEKQRVWSVNPDSDSVCAIDTTSLTRLFEAPVGREPHSLAQAPDGSIWVTNQSSDEVTVLDRDSGAVLTRIALPYASQPRAIAFGPSGKGYVTLFASGQLLELDSAARSTGRELALGPTPAGVSVAGDGRVFVTRFLSPLDHGEIFVVEPQALTLVNTITLPFDTGPDTQSSGRGVPNYVSSIAISPDGTQAWISAKKDNVARGLQRDGLAMTSDNFVRSAVCSIDLGSETEIVAKRQDLDNRSMPVAVAFSPRGDYAFVAVLTSNWIGVMDAYTTTNLSGLRDVGNAPDGLVILPDGRLFTNAFLSREVLVYDMQRTLSSEDHTAPEPLARIRTTDREPLAGPLLLGKQVYYNAEDKRMGHAGYWSCASCHFGGFSDGRVWDFSDRGEGLRNTKSLLGIRGTLGQGRVHWSGNMDEIQDFERDIRETFDGLGFMSDADYDARKDASGNFDPFGTPSAGVSPELDALAAYITSFDRVGRSPYRNADGSFTPDARDGREIFQKAGCPACHPGPDFTDSAMNVLHDVGTLRPSSGMRLGGPLTGIDTPTLKGLWQTAPYLHDGRAATLADVFAITGDRMGTISNLSRTEMDHLIRYLLELDDVPETVVNPPPTTSAADRSFSCGFTHGHGSTSAWLLAGVLLAGRCWRRTGPLRRATSRVRLRRKRRT